MGCNFGTKSNPIVIDDSEDTNSKKKKEKPKKVEVISSDEETAEDRIKKEKDKKAKFNEKLFEKLSSKVASERKRRKSPKRNEPDKNFQEEIRLLKVSDFIFMGGMSRRKLAIYRNSFYNSDFRKRKMLKNLQQRRQKSSD